MKNKNDSDASYPTYLRFKMPSSQLKEKKIFYTFSSGAQNIVDKHTRNIEIGNTRRLKSTAVQAYVTIVWSQLLKSDQCYGRDSSMHCIGNCEMSLAVL